MYWWVHPLTSSILSLRHFLSSSITSELMSYWLSMCSGFLKIMIFQQCSRNGHGMCDGSARCCACSQHLLSCIMFLLYVMTGLLGHVTPVRDDRPLGHIVHSAQLSQLSRKRPSLEVSSIQEEKRKKCTSNVGTCAQCLVMFLLSLTRTPWSAWPTFHSSWWYRTLHCVVMVAMQLPRSQIAHNNYLLSKYQNLS